MRKRQTKTHAVAAHPYPLGCYPSYCGLPTAAVVPNAWTVEVAPAGEKPTCRNCLKAMGLK